METVLIFFIFFRLTIPALILAIILCLIVLVVFFFKRRKPGKGRSLNGSLPTIEGEETLPAENSVLEAAGLREASNLDKRQPVGEIEKGPEPQPVISKWSEADSKTLFRDFIVGFLKARGFEITSTHAVDEVLTFQQEDSAGNQSVSIGIVAVWKPGFIKGRIEWARGFQMIGYRQYEKTENRPVFVLIGIEGSPKVPESVYLLPLKQIRSNVLSEIQLRSCLLPSNTGVLFESAV